MKRLSAVLLCFLALTLPGLAKSAPKKSAIPAAPDKAYLDLYPFEKIRQAPGRSTGSMAMEIDLTIVSSIQIPLI